MKIEWQAAIRAQHMLNMDENTSEAEMLEDSSPESGAAEQEEETPIRKRREEVF